ncbi:MAG: DUF5103 domain-containing protein [Ignavibacteriales bacterium]|nr:DUF5103 domain-containing protein [Ignavibacteriales bacterium]
MKFQIITLAITLSIFSTTLGADNIEIKSLRVYPKNSEIELPVLDLLLNDKNTITIEFDIKTEFEPQLNIIFKFCDEEWHPYDNIFLRNETKNTAYNLSFTRLPMRITNASYHYKGTFPNKDVSFPFSGKWMFFVVDPYDENTVYASGKFYVIQPRVNLTASLKKYLLSANESSTLPEDRTYFTRVDFSLPDEFPQTIFPAEISHIEIIRNQETNNPIIIKQTDNDQTRYCEWVGANSFSFFALDIQPGNEYRQTNLMDINRFSYPVTNAQLDEIETSRFFIKGKKDNNGGFFLMNYTNAYAEYLNVNFSIQMPYDFYKSIFLVGAFNNWQLLPEYEMKRDNNAIYRKQIELKRGVYDYQYVVADFDGKKITNEDWIYLEGNFWETRNILSIFLYYDNPNLGGYSEIIGYLNIVSDKIWIE